MAKPMTKTEWLNWLEKAWDEAQQAAWAEKQEPVAWMWKDGTLTSDPDVADGTWTPLFTAPVHASDISQECVDETAKGEHDTLGSEWVECVKLPIVVHVRNQREGETHISTREGITPVLPDDLIMRGVAGEEYPIGRGLFERTYTFDTAPPKKEWVKLTDEEIYDYADKFLYQHGSNYGIKSFGKAIEAKLKEKNGG